MGLIRFLAIFLLIVYGLRLLGKYLLPILIRRQVNKMQENAQRQYRASNKKKEGEVTIEKNKKRKETKGKDKYGEYTDFEEID